MQGASPHASRRRKHRAHLSGVLPGVGIERCRRLHRAGERRRPPPSGTSTSGRRRRPPTRSSANGAAGTTSAAAVNGSRDETHRHDDQQASQPTHPLPLSSSGGNESSPHERRAHAASSDREAIHGRSAAIRASGAGGTDLTTRGHTLGTRASGGALAGTALRRHRAARLADARLFRRRLTAAWSTVAGLRRALAARAAAVVTLAHFSDRAARRGLASRCARRVGCADARTTVPVRCAEIALRAASAE